MKQKQIIRTIFYYRKYDTTSKAFLENNIESVYELYFSLLIKKCILNHSLGKSPEIVEFRRNVHHSYKTRSKVKGKIKTLRPILW